MLNDKSKHKARLSAIALTLLSFSLLATSIVPAVHADSTVLNTGTNQNGGGSATSISCTVTVNNKGDMVVVAVGVISVNEPITISFNSWSDTFGDSGEYLVGPVTATGSSSSSGAAIAAFASKSTGSDTITVTYNSGPSVIGCFDLAKSAVSYWVSGHGYANNAQGTCTSSCGTTVQTNSWGNAYPPGLTTIAVGSEYDVSNTVTSQSGYTTLKTAWGWNDIEYEEWYTQTKASYTDSVAPASGNAYAIAAISLVPITQQSNLLTEVQNAATWVNHVTQPSFTAKGYTSQTVTEAVGAPIWVKDTNTGVIVRAGENVFAAPSSCPDSVDYDTQINGYSAAYSSDSYLLTFYVPTTQQSFGGCTTSWQQFTLQITETYSSGQVTVAEYCSGFYDSDSVNIYLGSATLATGINSGNCSTTHSLTVSSSSFAADLAQFRYTVRHTDDEMYAVLTYANSHGYFSSGLASYFNNFAISVNGFNIQAELYQPIWGSFATTTGADHASWWGQNFIFQDASVSGTTNQQPYYDCASGVQASMWGAGATGTSGSTRVYDYLSKVCRIPGGVDSFIGVSADDNLDPLIWALHQLNIHGGSPYTAYQAQSYKAGSWSNLNFFGGSQSSWSPDAVANQVYNANSIYSGSTWEGIQACVNYQNSPISFTCQGYASGVRTAAFAALTTDLCYNFGDTGKCALANLAINALQQVQIPQNGVFSFGGTSYYRPQMAGVIPVAWDPFNAVPAGGIVSTVIDLLYGMNDEYPPSAVVPGNTETTLVTVGALCQFNSIVYSASC